MSYKWNHVPLSLLDLASFMYHNVLRTSDGPQEPVSLPAHQQLISSDFFMLAILTGVKPCVFFLIL